MALKAKGKRPAQTIRGPSKRRKIAPSKDAADGRMAKSSKAKSSKAKGKGKEKAMDRGIIPIPVLGNDEDMELSDEDVDMLEEYGSAVAFLDRLDEKGITRSKKETERLYQLHKPARQTVEDDLPSIDSHDEDEDSWSSNIDENDADGHEDDGSQSSEADDAGGSSASSSTRPEYKRIRVNSDDEMSYETFPRKRRPSWEPESDKEKGIQRLPIKLSDGRIQKSTSKVILDKAEESGEDDEEEMDQEESQQQRPHGVEDVSTGARFGRPAVVDVIGNKSRRARVQGAKEQIAGICQDIVSDPENSLGLLRRLHTFSLPEISTPTHPEPVTNDVIIRRLTLLSQLAVFQDIIPGYRIRALTDKEKTEKVSQMVQRTRDWEQGLVSVYQSYLRTLEAEVKAKSELAEMALQCMCTLLVEATHFNFRINLMNSIVASLSRKSWDKSSDLCLNSIIKVLRADATGDASLEIVRLLNRMIKERRFNVHPNVLSCLLCLRLKTELGVRASESRADKEQGKTYSKGRAAARRAKGKSTATPHLSKNAKKALKERQEIQKEMREAEAEVDSEERAAIQTETLKLLFVLYFRILKHPAPTPLLPAALRGISKFAHLVNIDFFRDLMQVLKDIIARASESEGADDDDGRPDSTGTKHAQDQLQCIVTAFELLSGQGACTHHLSA
ncbi:nucleolar complex-associated protein-domain-containing protein [Sparassis latifolia]